MQVAVAGHFYQFLIRGFADVHHGLRQWRQWHLLGIVDLRRRYARSKVGQLWLVISMAMLIICLSSVWALLWRQPVADLMPFVGSSLIFWGYLSAVITECTNAFSSHVNIYRNQKTSFAVSIYSIIYKNTLILAHNALVIAAVILIFQVPLRWYLFQLVPGFILVWITMTWGGYLIAMVCARYRDVAQIVAIALQIAFFITPVLWKPASLPRDYQFIVNYNPFAHFLELLRNPVLGEPVNLDTWLVTVAITFGGALLALPIIGYYERRLIYWV
jgi:ABC-type polysaccharide/polyol phosphate export permease